MMSKKVLCFVVAIMLVGIMFVGCASTAAPAASSSAPASSAPAASSAVASPSAADTASAAASGSPAKSFDKTYKIVFVCADMANESQAFASKMFQKHAADYGFEVSVMDAKGDATTESQIVTTCIAQKVAAIFVNPNDINGIVPSLMAAKQAGIVVGMFSSDLTAQNQQYRNFYVGANDVEAGKLAGQAFIKQFPSGASIVEVGGQAGHDAEIKRHDGFTEAIKGSNIKVLDSQNCKTWSTSDAMNIMQDFNVKYGSKIQGVFCHWDNGLTGVIQAMKAAKVDNMFSVAIDGCRAGFDQVKAGTETICYMQNFETMASTSMDLCRKVLDGGTVEPINYIKWDTVSKDTIGNFAYPEW